MNSSRSRAVAAVLAILVAGVFVIALLRGGGGAPTTPTPSPSGTITAASPSSTITGGTASPTSTAASSLVDDRFGFFVTNGEARVRSETSDAMISSFAPKGRSFSSLSRVVSPDGRSVAYWDPVTSGAVLRVGPVTGGTARAVLTGRPEMKGNAFTWSADGGGLVAALDNDCFIGNCTQVAELWTIDLASGATEKIASGSIWLPLTWDRTAKLIAAGVTGEGGYVVAYDVIDLRQKPYAVRSTEFRPTVLGRLKASSDARFVLLWYFDQGGATSLAWWPLAQPEKRAAITFDGSSAEWRPGTSELWWIGGLNPPGCRSAPCGGSELIAFDVVTGARRSAARGTFGASLLGFRVDGSAAYAAGATGELLVVDVRSGTGASIPISGHFGEAVRLN